MTPTTANSIEVLLFQHGTWLSSEFLQSHFSISERRLRRLGAGFLVSRPGAYIHYHHATEEEFNAYHNPKRMHAVTELVNLRALRTNRENGRLPVDDNGQVVGL